MQGSGFQAMVCEFGEIELFWSPAPATLIYSELTMAEKIRSHVTPGGEIYVVWIHTQIAAKNPTTNVQLITVTYKKHLTLHGSLKTQV